MLRLFGILATVLFAIAAAVLTWPSFFRLERTFPIAQVISFRGLLVLAFVAVVVVALLLAMWRPLRGFALSIALVAGVAVIANVSVLVSRGLGADTLPAGDRDERARHDVEHRRRGDAGASGGADRGGDGCRHHRPPRDGDRSGESVAVAMRDMGRPMWVHHVQYNPRSRTARRRGRRRSSSPPTSATTP